MLKYNKHEIFTKSNFISILRMVLAIPAWYFLSKIGEHDNYRIIVIIVFFLAYVSDLLDGYLARKFNEITEFGKVIDPLADKVFVITIILQLFFSGEITSTYFWIILLRDVIIMIGGLVVSKTIGKVLPSNLLGKMTVASIALFLLGIICGVKEIPWLFYFLQYTSIIFSFASVLAYGLRAYETIKWYSNNGNS